MQRRADTVVRLAWLPLRAGSLLCTHIPYVPAPVPAGAGADSVHLVGGRSPGLLPPARPSQRPALRRFTPKFPHASALRWQPDLNARLCTSDLASGRCCAVAAGLPPPQRCKRQAGCHLLLLPVIHPQCSSLLDGDLLMVLCRSLEVDFTLACRHVVGTACHVHE